MNISEQQLRREALKQGYRLRKSRMHAGSLTNYGWWQVLFDNGYSQYVEAGENFDMTDEDVARFLGLLPKEELQ